MKKARPIKMSDGQSLKVGGKAYGPSHKEDGIIAHKEGRAKAEIEGGERVFSQEDTEYMETEAEKIQKYMESMDIDGADKCAKDLGYAVAKMLTQQDMNEARQANIEEQAPNQFSNVQYY